MRHLWGKEELQAKFYMEQASTIALSATCQRSQCGSIIVSNNHIIGTWFNSPPHHQENQRRCIYSKSCYHTKVTDKTCCIHAEQRAIIDALRYHPNQLSWSKLYFIRLDDNQQISYAGKPYCTICSKMALDVGITEFILRHEDGIYAYHTQEYNTLSYLYNTP